MNEEEKNKLNELFFNTEKYIFDELEDYKEYNDYVIKLLENVDSYKDEELKFLLKNWFFKQKVYKKINVNSLYVYLTKYAYVNLLKLLQMREYTDYKNNAFPFTLNIVISANENILFDDNIFKNIENISDIFDIKNILVYDDVSINDELKQYIKENNYNVIYVDSKKEENLNNIDEIYININTENINLFENIIEQYKEKVKKIYFTCNDENDIIKNTFRLKINEYILKYNNSDFSIILNDYYPGQHLGIDEFNNLFLKFNTKNILVDISNISIEESVDILCKLLIQEFYVKKECLEKNCDEIILCMLGISDKDCEYKIF